MASTIPMLVMLASVALYVLGWISNDGTPAEFLLIPFGVDGVFSILVLFVFLPFFTGYSLTRGLLYALRPLPTRRLSPWYFGIGTGLGAQLFFLEFFGTRLLREVYLSLDQSYPPGGWSPLTPWYTTDTLEKIFRFFVPVFPTEVTANVLLSASGLLLLGSAIGALRKAFRERHAQNLSRYGSARRALASPAIFPHG